MNVQEQRETEEEEEGREDVFMFPARLVFPYTGSTGFMIWPNRGSLVQDRHRKENPDILEQGLASYDLQG